jgi:NADPH:quinone reductase-like Zn-dependent oxidoreductase
MQAAVLTAPGTPHIGEFAEPTAGEGQLVVDVLVAGLNPVDLTMASDSSASPAAPQVAGREGVARTPDGRRVYFRGAVAPYGSMAPRTLVDATQLIDVPDGLADDMAVALGIAGLAAWLPLAWAARLQPGETVLVLGATGVLGTIAVQAARLLGAGRIVAAGRNPEGLARAREHGAHATVDLNAGGDLTQAIRDAAGGGVDVTIDPIWGPPGVAALGATNRFARHVQIGSSAGRETPVGSAFRQSGTSIIGYTTNNVPMDDRRDAYARMAAHVAAGEIVVDVERVPLADLDDAWRRQAASPHRKLVLVP